MSDLEVSKVVDVIYLHNPFDPKDQDRVELAWVNGKSLYDYFGDLGSNIAVSINGQLVEERDHPVTYLAEGDCVVLCELPEGGGGDSKSVLRMVAMLAVAAASGGAGAAAFGAGTFGAAAAQAGITVVGGMLVNALLPPPKQEAVTQSPAYGIDGAKNTSAEGLPVPVIYGYMKTAGNIVNTYVSNEGSNQYLHMLVVLSEGPVASIDRVELNDQTYTYYSTEIYMHRGTPDQPVIPYFDDTVIPNFLGITLSTNWTFFATGIGVDRLRLDLSFPGGLVSIDTQGKTWPVTVDLQVQLRPFGTVGAENGWVTYGDTINESQVESGFARYIYTDFTESAGSGDAGTVTVRRVTGSTNFATFAEFVAAVPGAYVVDGIIYQNDVENTAQIVGAVQYSPVYSNVYRYSDKIQQPFRRSITITPPTPGRYEMRLRRLTEDNPVDQVLETVVLSDVNEVLTDNVSYKNTAIVGMRIKLTDQLNSLPNVTIYTRGRLCPVWNGTAFVEQYTRNPAWIALDAMTNRRYGLSIPWSRIDTPAMIDWATYCNANNLWFDGVFDVVQAGWDAIVTIARAGRAMPVTVGTRYSFAIERPAAPVMMFSTANMAKGSFSQSWLPMTERANEIEVSFLDSNDQFKRRSIRIVDPVALASGVPQRSASINLLGIVEAERATREAILQLNMNRFVTQSIEFEAPLEAIACAVGDLIYVQDDYPQWGFGGKLASGSTTGSLVLDRPVPMTGGKSYSALVRHDALQVTTGVVSSIAGRSLTLTGFTNSAPVKRIRVMPGGNLVPAPCELNDASWLLRAAAAVTPNATDAPDGSRTADLVSGLSGAVTGGDIRFFIMTGTASGTRWEPTFWIRRASTTGVVAVFQAGGSNVGEWRIDLSLLSDNWEFITQSHPAVTQILPFVASITGLVGLQFFRFSGASPLSFHLWGVTMVQGTVGVPFAYVDREVTGVWSQGGGAFGVLVDDTTGINATRRYELWNTDSIEERAVLNPSAGTSTVEYTTITLASPLSTAPARFVDFLFGENNKVKKPFRVKSVSGGTEYTRRISAIEYNESVYNTTGFAAPTPNYSALTTGPQPPTIDGVFEELVSTGTGFVIKATVMFTQQGPNASMCRSWVSRNLEQWEDLGYSNDRASVFAQQGELLHFLIQAIDVTGTAYPFNQSPITSLTIRGKLKPPANVLNFKAETLEQTVVLTWDAVQDLDLVGYEIRQGTSWDDSTPIVLTYSGTTFSFQNTVPNLSNVMIRAIDSSGIYSEAVATINLIAYTPPDVTNFGAAQNGNRIEMTWARTSGSDVVSYEIREGTSWLSSVFLGLVDVTYFSIPAAGRLGLRTFLIKAKYRGAESVTAHVATVNVVDTLNRNAVVQRNEHLTSWAGPKRKLSIADTSLYLNAADLTGDYLTYLDTTVEYRASMSVFAAVEGVVGGTSTWLTSTFTWDSATADRPWVVTTNSAFVSVGHEIAIYTGLTPDVIESFPLNSSSVGLNATTAAVATSVTYGGGRYGAAYNLNTGSTLRWNFAIPASFSQTFWFRPAALGVGTYPIATLYGPSSINLMLTYVVLVGGVRVIRLQSTAGSIISVEVPVIETGDVLVGIVQTATQRTLMIASPLFDTISAVGELAPVGAITGIALNV